MAAYRWLVVIMMVCAVTHLCFADEQLTNLNGEQDDDLLTISRHSDSQSSMHQRGPGPGWMDEPSSAAPLESTDAKFDHPLIKGAKNKKDPIQCDKDKYKFSIPARCLSSVTVLDKASGYSHKGFKGTAIQITAPKGQRGGGGPGNLMKLQTKIYTLNLETCAKQHASQIPFGGKMTLRTSTEVCCNCPECSRPEFQCENKNKKGGDKYCDQTAPKNICSTEQGIKDCRKSCHRCPHNFPKCGGTCYTEDYGKYHNKCTKDQRAKKADSAAMARECDSHKKNWIDQKKEFKHPIISKDSEKIELNDKDLDLSNEWQVCVAAALQEHATIEQRKGAAGDIGNMAGGGYIGRGGGVAGSNEPG